MADIDPTDWGRLQQTVEMIHGDVKEIKVDVKKQNGRTDCLEKALEPILQAQLPVRVSMLEMWSSRMKGGLKMIGITGGVLVGAGGLVLAIWKVLL